MTDLKKNYYRFNKEDGNWYIDLPNWEGPKSALAMVAGADTLLDELSNNGDTVLLSLVTESDCPEGHKTLKKIIRTPPNGCIYHLGYVPIWLCDVTKFVFNGIFPKKIYFKVL
jgi:hypothetical protein